MNRAVAVLFALLYILEAILKAFIPKSFLLRKKFDRDIVLITGGGSGLGRALAIKFALRGCKRIVIWDINQTGLTTTFNAVENAGAKCWPYLVDVSKAAIVTAMAKKVREEVGSVTILVNNAGIVSGKRLLELNDKQIEETFKVNAIAHFWTTRTFLPAMIAARRGHLVTVASVAGLGGAPKLTDYCASKFAAIGLDESLRLELKLDGHTNIKSTLVLPWYFDSGLFQGFKTGLIPGVSLGNLSEQIVTAVSINQELLITPTTFFFIPFLKQLLPSKAYWTIYHDVFGFSNAMTDFEGRKVSNVNNPRRVRN